MMESLGGRKFIGFIIVSILLTILVMVGKLDATMFVTFITANFGIYTAGNAVDKVVDK